MPIYTRTGDAGDTGLFGGKRVPKDDVRIEAYGTIDELNAALGLLAGSPFVSEGDDGDWLLLLQSDLFTIGSHLATVDPAMMSHLPTMPEERLSEMEKWMDQKTEALPELKQFILPGGHAAVAQAHWCRVVCRRAERRVVALAHAQPSDSVTFAVRYLNRLSDLFFTWSRVLSQKTGGAERPWSPS
jgi:cob(I)alamin adenosyltransferase